MSKHFFAVCEFPRRGLFVFKKKKRYLENCYVPIILINKNLKVRNKTLDIESFIQSKVPAGGGLS